MHVLEQSRALTTLAAQIASKHGDPLTELTGATAGTRGAAGRAKLQAELALHRGTFFNAVLQQMSRRMAPSSAADVSAATLMSREDSGLRNHHCGQEERHFLLATDDIDMVRRRGRWMTNKVCEVYLQDVLYVTYTEKLPKHVRTRIQTLASAFSAVLRKAIGFLNIGLPPSVWYPTFKAQDNVELGAYGGIMQHQPKTWPSCRWTTAEAVKRMRKVLGAYTHTHTYIYVRT